MKPIEDVTLENIILEKLSRFDFVHSNELFRMLHVGKKRYTRIKDHMVEQGYITQEKQGNKTFLKRAYFTEDEKFKRTDYTKTSRINCKNYLKTLKKIRPIVTSSKNPRLSKNAKIILDALFFQLDTLHIIGTKLEYAGAFGLMREGMVRTNKNTCMNLFEEITESLLSDHKKFRDLILDYYQSKVRIMKFKL